MVTKVLDEQLLHIDPSSTEEENYDDEGSFEDEEDEQEEEDMLRNSLFWMELTESWRQHAVAILVAFVATMLFFCQKEQFNTIRPAPVLYPAANQRARLSYLDGYIRTASISFCDSDLAINALNHRALAQMDFHVPKTLIPSLKLHFLADLLKDDDYSLTLAQKNLSINEENHHYHHHSLDCIDRLAKESQQSFIKGFTYFYKAPDFGTMYSSKSTDAVPSGDDGKMISLPQPAHLTFSGFAAMFFNLSPKAVLLFWDGRNVDQRRLVGEIPPFESLGTATTPGQSFSVSPVYDSHHALGRWIVTADECLIYYEPDNGLESLTISQQQQYYFQKLNQEFAKHYLIATGRPWLSNFPRSFPVHNIWPATYFGQSHSLLDKVEGTRLLLKVESVTPRVFSIDGLLSSDECEQLIQLAIQQGLHASTVYSGALAEQQRDLLTRSSMNTWLARSTAELTDQIYRRAAVVLGMNESFLQAPEAYEAEGDGDSMHPHYSSLAESIQVVRYQKGQEFTPHHDFIRPRQLSRLQPTRFATLLMYLNDDFDGGHTIFPRAVNAHYHDGIRIHPKQGKAVLFYNVLPDGNLDDLSQHSSQPVENGEKFLANLWIWEPVIN